MKIKIYKACCGYEVQPFKSAFGFKGNSLTGVWQTAVKLETKDNFSIGLGIQSVLWSDAGVFDLLGEEKGNMAMLSLTQYAVKECENAEFETPIELIDMLFPKVYNYAKKIFNGQKVRKTFVLNALVPVDLAAWQLWAKENKCENFDLISKFDGQHQEKLANIPLVTYGTHINDVVDMAKQGVSLFKIKIGSDPNKDNDRAAMLEWDKNRILEIHNALKDIKTPYTESGHILYYLDANGRYDTKERLQDFVDFADKEGILERIALIEEPFDEENKVSVADIPVCIAADESAHSLEDVKERFELGYKALTLKSIAKTLSMTIKMFEYAKKKGMTCFCADLTVNPVMISWNQNVAARLNPIKGMKIGVLESNGEQYYINWESMHRYHPLWEREFTKSIDGIFKLDQDFYNCSGGIFISPKHYMKLVEEEK